ncbi:hypothetical protein [Prevotella aff. ruminicola Tc2-24]|uniref:hypothetical protein n=1 Tax=Prevotella aff. ruminicola Tc2-24 TaxID=81582 RepID=UPI00116004C7|nr:hypothetical protein [Prevotella aff. ruminicola Tc2-24]
MKCITRYSNICITQSLTADATSISNTKSTTTEHGAYYSQNGQRTEHPSKGIYIMNGKKTL